MHIITCRVSIEVAPIYFSLLTSVLFVPFVVRPAHPGNTALHIQGTGCCSDTLHSYYFFVDVIIPAESPCPTLSPVTRFSSTPSSVNFGVTVRVVCVCGRMRARARVCLCVRTSARI